MQLEVFLTKDARLDLDSILDYIADKDSVQRAEKILDDFEEKFSLLALFPDRGEVPRELGQLGIKEFRQVYLKPYRIIYRVVGQRVYVVLVADGRRDIDELLQRRLLG